MTENIWEEIERIFVFDEYKDAVRKENWRQAHDLLAQQFLKMVAEGVSLLDGYQSLVERGVKP